MIVPVEDGKKQATKEQRPVNPHEEEERENKGRLRKGNDKGRARIYLLSE